MDLSQLSWGGVATALVTIIAFLVKGSMRLARLELKVETMWGFQMRRAVSESVSSGIGQFNSPLVFSAAANAALDPIRQQLLDFWMTLTPLITDADALLAIEARFGNDLLRYVCTPCGLSHGACLLLALSIAKGSGGLNLAPARLGWLLRFAAWFHRHGSGCCRTAL